ncbi:MAG TPA: hypothetical protein VMV17_20080 [Streptosporangiaceae bacterium]|nr:hypothetical protein [Streptosporangiaceae bacterium]
MIKRDLGRVLLACERLADQAVTAAQAPRQAWRVRGRGPPARQGRRRPASPGHPVLDTYKAQLGN